MIENHPDREELELHADRARSRLASTLETLDRRRREFVQKLDPKALARKQMPKLIAVGAATLVSLIGGALYAFERLRSRKRRSVHRNRDRWHALGRAWRHPERVVGDERPSLAMHLGRRILSALVGVAITALSRRIAASRELPAPRHTTA